MKAIATWQTLSYLRLAQARNFLRTLFRQSGFWALLAGAGFVVTVVRVLRGGVGAPDRDPIPPALAESLPIDLAAGAIAWFVIFWGVWRGTSKAPFEIREPDAVLILPSPITSRSLFAYHLAVDGVRCLWTALLMFGLSLIVLPVDPTGDELSFPWVYAGYLVASLLGRSLAFAEWSWLQALEGRAPERARRLRLDVRSGLVCVTLVSVLWLAAPVVGQWRPGLIGGWVDQPIVSRLVERLDALTSVPPANWVRGVVAGNGSLGAAGSLAERVWGGLGPALLLVGLMQAVAICCATDYYEPLVQRAERVGNLMRRAGRREVDAQGVALEAFRTETKWMVSLPAFGIGPGALLWSGLTRTVRFNTALVIVSIITYLLLGVGLGAAVRWWNVSVHWAWIAPSLLALLSGGAGNLVDELSRPNIYLFPGPPWQRLLAAIGVSVVDNVLNGIPFLAFLAVVAPLALADSLAAFVMLMAAAILSQATAGLGQIMLPSWIGGGTRSMLVFGLSAVLSAPGLIVYLLGVNDSATAVALPVAGAFLIAAAAAFALSVAFFDRAELAG